MTMQKDKHFSFEDPRATTSDPAGSKYCTQEWLESLEQAKETFLANAAQSGTTSYSGDGFLNGLNSPGLAAQSGSAAQAAYMQPQVPRPVRTRSQYASRSRMSLAGGDNNHMNPVDENGVNWIVPPERPVLVRPSIPPYQN